MRKLILKWLFGSDDIASYMKLLSQNLGHSTECINLINDHLKTLEKEKQQIDLIRKLIRVCENHGIDVDEEIKHIKLEDNANETLD